MAHDPHDLVIGGSVVQAILPIDFDNQARNGVWADMAATEALSVVVVLAAPGSAGVGPIITLEQATDSAGSGAKALSIVDARYLKAADIQAPSASELWAEITASRTSPLASWDADDVGGDIAELMVVITIRPADLDINNGFRWVRVKTVNGDSAAARLGQAMYIAKDRKYQGDAKPNLLG
jgi:hypothetical protein